MAHSTLRRPDPAPDAKDRAGDAGRACAASSMARHAGTAQRLRGQPRGANTPAQGRFAVAAADAPAARGESKKGS
ncbi:hypothetical protein [Azohydromonas aeria]|uniref:hypothetical protein n=1 Tax=Azohydromonas aeria TaxID=2590212 RepID=UPI0012FA3837|nr:hypothetical protein [Azohydromonas aeria]